MSTKPRLSSRNPLQTTSTVKGGSQDHPAPLQYHVSLFDLAGHRLHVRLRITEPNPIAQSVFLPTWIPGSYLIRDFARHVETFTAQNKHGTCDVTRPNTHSWVIHNSHGPIDIDIVIYAWDLSVRGAHIDQHHAFFNGTSVFLCVEGQEQRSCEVFLTAPAQFNHWLAYTSMPTLIKQRDSNTSSPRSSTGLSALEQPLRNPTHLDKSQPEASQPHLLGQFHAPNYDALIDYPFEIGTPQTIKFTACGAQHQLVFTGHIPHLDLARVRADAQQICESQIKLFEPKTQRAPFLDSAPVYTFFTMVTGDGYGGLEHRASTALITSRHSLPTLGQAEAPNAYNDFLGLLSHEYFHTWHVKRIKPHVFVPYDLTQANYTSLLWVFEGFTSYYDDLTLVRTGLLSEKTYLKRLGDTIASVMRQPGRLKQSVAQSSFEAWTKYYKQDENAPNAISSYYAKGSLVALCIDLSIRAATHNKRSLDDVMRYLWKHYGRDFFHKTQQPIELSTENVSKLEDIASTTINLKKQNLKALRTANTDREKRISSIYQSGLPEDDFAQAVHAATGVNLTKQINAWASGTVDLPLKKCLGFAGITMNWQAQDTHASIDANIKPTGAHLTISHVFENGTAHRAGLSAHDILIAIDGLKVGATRDSFKLLMARYRPKDHVNMTVFRGDVLCTFKVTLVAPALNQCALERA